MGLRTLAGADVDSLGRFVRIATFPPYRQVAPTDEMLGPKLEKWLGAWGDELGVGWEDEGGLVGAAWARVTDLVVRHTVTGDRLPEVILGVIAQRRGEQIGMRLVEGLQQRAADRGVPGLWLRVSEHNPAAIRVYDKAGFMTLQERTDAGLLVMVWELS